MRSFAENDGENVVEIIDKLNFKGVKEYYEKTDYLERYFYRIAVKENLKKHKELNQTGIK